MLIDVDGTAAEVARDQPIVEKVLREQATEVRVAEDEKDRAALWYGRLNAPNSVVQSGKGFFIGDVTVPRERIPEMQEAIQATAARHTDGLLFIAVTGHAGDGDLHPTTFFDKDNPKRPPPWKRRTTRSSTPHSVWAAPSPASTASAPRRSNS